MTESVFENVDQEAQALFNAILPYLSSFGAGALYQAFVNADAEQRATQVIAAKAFLASVGA